MKGEISLMQNGIDMPDFLTGVSAGRPSITEYPEQETNVKSETFSLVPSLSTGAVTTPALVRIP